MSVNRNPLLIPRKDFLNRGGSTFQSLLKQRGVPDNLAGPIADSLQDMFGHYSVEMRTILEIIERGLSSGPSLEHVAWSTDGNLTVADFSDRYEVINGGNTILVIANLSTALTVTNTVIEVEKAGVAIGTVTITAGQTRGTATITNTTIPGDILTLDCTSIGTGAALATVQLVIS